MLPTLSEQVNVEELDTDFFRSKALPQRTGNALPIAFGGCAIAVGIRAACKTVAPGFRVYSVLGSFLGPAAIDRVLYCRVSRTRDTRTFATRRMILFQLQDDGRERSCTQLSVDFQIAESALLTYHTPPKPAYGNDPDDQNLAIPTPLVLERSIQNGAITPAAANAYYKDFQLMNEHFETRHCVEGVSTQNALGLAKHAPTDQDQRPIYDRSCAEWNRVRRKLDSYEENIAALGFFMDGGLSFLPLHLDHMDFGDSSACSTLDFALRVISPEVQLENWLLRERCTIAASAGRTYSEGRVWTQDGRMVAVMSQTSILRPVVRKSNVSAGKL